MNLPAMIKQPLQRIIEPYSRSGPGRALPLYFWDIYGNWLSLKTKTGFLGSSGDCLSGAYTADFFYSHLLENLLPFWAANAVDRQNGGYYTHLDRRGKAYDPFTRITAMQARLVYAFSVGQELAPDKGYLELARHGMDFLRQSCWDFAEGGWYEQVSARGDYLSANKLGFTQSYALIGLAAYYHASQDPVILDWLEQAYDIMEEHCWDFRHWGYLESFTKAWKVELNRKTICVQLDMLRAIMALYSETGVDRFRLRAIQLGEVIIDYMFDPDYGCALEVFHPDWRYAPARMRDQIWVGHNLKGAWLLCQLDSLSPDMRFINAARRMVDYCLENSWDCQNGGFYQFLFRPGRIASQVKIWWTQTEGLNALLTLYIKTGEPRYRLVFERLAEYCFTHFVDPVYGEWFTACLPDGTPINDHKGGPIKSAYHTVQACLIAMQGLSSCREG